MSLSKDNKDKKHRSILDRSISEIIGEGFKGFKSETVPQKVHHSNLDLDEWNALFLRRKMEAHFRKEMREKE